MGFFKKLEKALRPPKPGEKPMLPHQQVQQAFAGPAQAPAQAAPVAATAAPVLTRAQRVTARRAALPPRAAPGQMRRPAVPTGPIAMANGGEVGRKSYCKK